jgi:hypothetical protein
MDLRQQQIYGFIVLILDTKSDIPKYAEAPLAISLPGSPVSSIK